MSYISIKEASEKWGISDSRIRLLCREGRIEGAIKIGRNWAIPFDAVKPIDGREAINKEYLGLEYDFTIIDFLKEKIDEHRLFSKRLAGSLHEKLLIIKNKDRARYYEVLDIAHTTMNYEPFIKLVTEYLMESERLWLSVLD